MKKIAVSVVIILLGYICLMLTSINSKIDAIYASGVQYAMLDEVRPQSFTGAVISDAALRCAGRLPATPGRFRSSMPV
jgi:hypothetical protein